VIKAELSALLLQSSVSHDPLQAVLGWCITSNARLLF